jgi:preprotein translocase subunit YajC
MAMLESVLNFFITSAQADTAVAAAPAAGAQGSNMTLLMMLGVFVFFLYFTVWRPQNKRAKEQKDLLNSLAKGDEVLTIGGIVGKIAKMTDTYVVLSVSDSVEMTILKSSIANALPKGTLKSI